MWMDTYTAVVAIIGSMIGFGIMAWNFWTWGPPAGLGLALAIPLGFLLVIYLVAGLTYMWRRWDTRQ